MHQVRGYQPDGHPPGGDVVDHAAPAVSCRDTVAGQALVQGQVPCWRGSGADVNEQGMGRFGLDVTDGSGPPGWSGEIGPSRLVVSGSR